MSMTRFTVTGLVLMGLLAVAIPADAQRELHHVPPVVNPVGDNPDYLHPFVDAWTFDHDMQFFAPADVDTFGGGPDLKTGWFATYDRVRMYVTRPEFVDSNTEGDFTWGNRFDVGYMTDEHHGWLFSIWHIDGPNAVDILEQERINVYEEDDEINSDPDTTVILRGGGGGAGGGGTQQQQTVLTGVPPGDRNDPVLGYRGYRLQDSLNVADLTSWELNKVIRLKKLHYGSVIEPFFGFRYMKFQDFTVNDGYQRFFETTDDPPVNSPLLPPIPPPLADDLENGEIEQLTSLSTQWDNYMVGGQLGLRWYKLKGRWNLSSEIRAFALQNFQSFRSTNNITTTYYDGTGVGDDVTFEFVNRDSFSAHDSEFVWGGEIRAEAAYAVTRDVSLKAGMAFMGLGRGIARGNVPGSNSEDVTMIGYTFGVNVNR